MTNLITLKRTTLSLKSTIGELYLPDAVFDCFILEDVCRPYKIPGQTAIPEGTYEIAMLWSNRFKRIMPRLLNVPFYDGILIHPGNDAGDTEGCLLTGKKRDTDYVTESRLAFDALFPKLKHMAEQAKLFIEIQGGYPSNEWGNAPPTA